MEEETRKPTSAEPPSADAPTEETPRPKASTAGSPAEAIDSGALILTCISLLASKAWESMGLVPDPATKRIERRIEDAQLAIDAAAALADLLRGKLGDVERRELDTLLMNLRLNFVEQRAKE